MTVLFGGAGSSNAPAEKSKTKEENQNQSPEGVITKDDTSDENRVRLVRII